MMMSHSQGGGGAVLYMIPFSFSFLVEHEKSPNSNVQGNKELVGTSSYTLPEGEAVASRDQDMTSSKGLYPTLESKEDVNKNQKSELYTDFAQVSTVSPKPVFTTDEAAVKIQRYKLSWLHCSDL